MLGNSGGIDEKGLLTFFYTSSQASLVAQMVKCLPTMQETRVQSLGQEDPLEEAMATQLQYSYLEDLHGPRSLVGYSPRGHKESDTTERLHFIPLHRLSYVLCLVAQSSLSV